MGDDARRDGEKAFNVLSAIPPRYDWATFDSPEFMSRLSLDASAFGLLVSWIGARHTGDVVTITGKAGCGKSSLAIAAMRAMASHSGITPCFVSAFDLGMARSQHPLGEGEAPIVRHAKAAPILVVDDVGRELSAGHGVIAEIVHHRYDFVRTTFVTTHLGDAAVCKLYGDGVARRMFYGEPFPTYLLGGAA